MIAERCWEVRSEVNSELNFPPKLRGARSRLYRRRFLQVNTRWKALAEIYTMHSFAPFSNLNFLVKNRQNVFAIELMNFINSIAKNSSFAFFLRIFDEFFSGFRAKFQKIVTCVAFSSKFAKTNQKFAEKLILNFVKIIHYFSKLFTSLLTR